MYKARQERSVLMLNSAVSAGLEQQTDALAIVRRVTLASYRVPRHMPSGSDWIRSHGLLGLFR